MLEAEIFPPLFSGYEPVVFLLCPWVREATENLILVGRFSHARIALHS